MEIRITARLTINAETAILDPAAGFKEELGAFRAAFEKAGGKVEINVVRPTGPRPKKGAEAK